MYIIGLGGSLHDFSACLLKDDQVVVAIEEERITRQKHAIDKPALEKAILNNQTWKFVKNLPQDLLQKSVDYCLDYAGIGMKDVDFFVTTDSNIHLPFVKSLDHLVIANHHLIHAASAFYPSEYEEAAILIIDGKGSQVNHNGQVGYETVTFAYGKGNKIEILSKVLDHSVGHFYEAVTLGLGFGILEDGKTMGLSSWGKDTPFREELKKAYCLLPEGQIEFAWDHVQVREYIKERIAQASPEEEFEVKSDLAYAAQKALEEIVTHFVKYLYEVTGLTNLCIAGGVGLNSVANGVIYGTTPFKNLFIQPAAGDNGLAIGAAYYGAYYLRNIKRKI